MLKYPATKIFIRNSYAECNFSVSVCLQTTVPPPGCARFTEDSLLRHAQFVIDQVRYASVGWLNCRGKYTNCWFCFCLK